MLKYLNLAYAEWSIVQCTLARSEEHPVRSQAVLYNVKNAGENATQAELVYERTFGCTRKIYWELGVIICDYAAAPTVEPPRRLGLPRVDRFFVGFGFEISPPPSINLISSSMLRESLNLLPRDS